MKESARIVVGECMGVKRSEEVLIIIDEKTRRIGNALFDAAKSAGAEAVLVEIVEREAHGCCYRANFQISIAHQSQGGGNQTGCQDCQYAGNY